MEACWNRPYFFDQGILFECRGCGNCCCGAPGVVRLTIENIKQIASFVQRSPQEILKDSVYPYQAHYSIRERKDGSCLYYEDGCRIYPVRPTQCSTYPFWISNLRSEESWRRTMQECPGIGRGTLYTKEQILTALNQRL